MTTTVFTASLLAEGSGSNFKNNADPDPQPGSQMMTMTVFTASLHSAGFGDFATRGLHVQPHCRPHRLRQRRGQGDEVCGCHHTRPPLQVFTQLTTEFFYLLSEVKSDLGSESKELTRGPPS
jgi:hypothetical protein